MPTSTTPQQRAFLSDISVLVALAFGLTLLHVVTNGQYGFHRDELATVDDARHLAWGYVAYPPLTPFLGRVSLQAFGPSLRGIRLFPALAMGVSLLLAGLMAYEMGGKRFAQVVAALAVAIAPVPLRAGALLQYVAFDYLWWVGIAYLTIRLLRTDDPRVWVGIGATVGLGMLTKYSVLFLVAGLLVGLVMTDARKYLKSRWLWIGVALSVLIFLPNLIWQIQHQFISMDFLRHIHARDVRIGRTDGFLSDQLKIVTNFITIPLWVAGLVALLALPKFKMYRPVAWMFIVPFVLFLIAKGRGYYMAPAYPMLLAAGAVAFERWATASSLMAARSGWLRAATFALMAIGGMAVVTVALPLAPVNSAWWNRIDDSDFKEEIGWPELTGEVARIWNSLPGEEKSRTAILASNYGEAGAVDLYGPALGLPQAISGVNSYWQRGYGDPPPQTLIVLGLSGDDVEYFFTSCQLSGHVTNRYGVKNEETSDHPDIFVCQPPRSSWPEFWAKFRHFG
jgi:hypothetical protein